ncbi:MAG: peptide chain release factor 1 [Clostridiales Family XIII bacterium]|jgi:peptide chain release factor 1|nr:peptide chain release factor 1 [Clostridiales Family XIII bacterium]
MFGKLESILHKYDELAGRASDPDVISDQPQWQKIVKEMGELEPVVLKYRAYKVAGQELADAKDMIENGGLDAEEKELFRAEQDEIEPRITALEEELKVLLLPKDPNDAKNVILEIRAGTGGEEAGLFAGDLLRMYIRYAERHGWETELLDMNDTGIGAVKEAIVIIKGRGAYSRLKYESGVHRVQRVPETESSGRVHTSAATVAVLPEVDDVEIDIDPNDVRVDVYRSSGNGGQSVNTTDSAVRLTHEPTGLVVTCQDEKSQIKNKDKAWGVLRARLYDLKMQEQNKEVSDARRSMVGSGDRSERIRTYNYPQGRISDHRIGLTIYKLSTFMDGDLDEVLDALITSDQTERMSSVDE